MNESEGLFQLAYKSIDETKELLDQVKVLMEEGSMKSLSKVVEVTEDVDLESLHAIARDLVFNRLESVLSEKGYRISRYDDSGNEESDFRVYRDEMRLGLIDPRKLCVIVLDPEEEIQWRESVLKRVHREDYQEDIVRFKEMKPILDEFLEVVKALGIQVR